MKKDMKNDVEARVAIAAQALSGGAEEIAGVVIDTKDYDALTFLLQTTTLSASSLAAVPFIEHSDEVTFGGEEEAVADVDLVGTEAEAGIDQDDDLAVKRIGYVGNKRYVRMNLVVSANNGTDVISGLALLGKPHAAPVAQG